MTARAGSATTRERNAIRGEMRERRRALPRDARLAANRALCRHILGSAVFRRAKRVGIFMPFDGEPDLSRIAVAATRRGKKLFVPVLRGLDMSFAELPRGNRLVRNFFGILEPLSPRLADARSLDLVLTPFVAYDARGGRIGVGRGYYDRCFGFLRLRKAWLRPKLVGVGYSLQEVPCIELKPWDVTLWGIATERGFRRVARPA